MPAAHLLPPLLIAAGGIALMAINLRKARTIEDTPTAKIRSAAQGYVGINGFGRAIGDEPLRAPLTGKPCLWYRYTIERYESGNKRSSWETVESGTSEQFFAIDDSTGICHIDPRRADVTTEFKQCWKGYQRRPAGALATIVGGGFGGDYRYTEYRIHPGEWVYVLGWYETTHAPSLAERTAAQTRRILNEWKQDRDALLARFDQNGDGDISLPEWERARRAATQLAREQVLQQPEQQPINIVSRPPLRDKPYLIASKDPRELARRYRRHAALALLGGLGVAAFTLWNFYYR